MASAQADLEAKLKTAASTRAAADAAKAALLKALRDAHVAVSSAEGASAQV